MKLLPRLVIVLAVCLIGLALPAAPAEAQCGGPVIQLSPASGTPGTHVAVSGKWFDKDRAVDILHEGTVIGTGQTDGTGAFTVAITIPEEVWKGPYQVQAMTTRWAADTNFAVWPGLTASPDKGPVGTNVTVKGRGFAQDEPGIEVVYYVDDNYQTIERRIVADAQGSWEVSFLVPASARGEHKIDAQSTESQFYDVADATFRVTAEISLDMLSGIVGETITMTGGRFDDYEKGIQILFDGQPVATDIKAGSKGDWEAIFQVPEMPAGNHDVTAAGQLTKNGDVVAFSFEIKPDILLSVNTGNVGMDLTVTGHGFAANKTVSLMYDGSQKATAPTNDNGSFETSFIVPASQHGDHQVTAGYSAGNAASAVFTMESTPPPIPALISPRDQGWMGLKSGVTPTFEWSPVSDASGVSYSLQVSTSPDVTGTGEFVEPLVSLTGIAGTSYTLDKADALPNGTYYWIVRAVDGADNDSAWTAARSFRAGLLPLWAFILIILGVVVVLGVLAYFLVSRRRGRYLD